jgi:hypothetical protein
MDKWGSAGAALVHDDDRQKGKKVGEDEANQRRGK